MVAKVEGADAGGLSGAVGQYFGKGAEAWDTPPTAASQGTGPAKRESLQDRLQALITQRPVMLFMKVFPLMLPLFASRSTGS